MVVSALSIWVKIECECGWEGDSGDLNIAFNQLEGRWGKLCPSCKKEW